MELWYILLSLSSCSGRWGSSCLSQPSFVCFSLSPAGWWGRDGSGHLDPGWEEWLHQPALLQHILCNCLHPGGGWGGGHGHWHPWVLCHLQRAPEFAESGEFCLFYLGEAFGCVMLQPYLFGLEQISLRSPAPDSSVVHVPGDRFYCRAFSSIHTKNVLHDSSKKCNCNTYALCENIYLKQFKTNSYCFCLLLLPCPFYILFWKMGRGRKIGETCNKTSF